MIRVGAKDRVEAAMGFVVMVVVFVKNGQVHQSVEMDRRAGADALVKLDGLGVFGAAIVEDRQAKRGMLVVGILVQRTLVKVRPPFRAAPASRRPARGDKTLRPPYR